MVRRRRPLRVSNTCSGPTFGGHEDPAHAPVHGDAQRASVGAKRNGPQPRTRVSVQDADAAAGEIGGVDPARDVVDGERPAPGQRRVQDGPAARVEHMHGAERGIRQAHGRGGDEDAVGARIDHDALQIVRLQIADGHGAQQRTAARVQRSHRAVDDVGDEDAPRLRVDRHVGWVGVECYGTHQASGRRVDRGGVPRNAVRDADDDGAMSPRVERYGAALTR